MIDFSRTAAALEQYDLHVERAAQAMFQPDCDNATVYRYMMAVEKYQKLLATAFWEDTQPINQLHTCLAVIWPGPIVTPPGAEPSLVRNVVTQWREAKDVRDTSERVRECSRAVP